MAYTGIWSAVRIPLRVTSTINNDNTAAAAALGVDIRHFLPPKNGAIRLKATTPMIEPAAAMPAYCGPSGAKLMMP